MTQLDLLLKDRKGKTVRLVILASVLGIKPEKLYRCIYNHEGWGLEKAYYYSMISKMRGYDFPVEMFLGEKYINLIKKALGVDIERYNPVSQM